MEAATHIAKLYVINRANFDQCYHIGMNGLLIISSLLLCNDCACWKLEWWNGEVSEFCELLFAVLMNVLYDNM